MKTLKSAIATLIAFLVVTVLYKLIEFLTWVYAYIVSHEIEWAKPVFWLSIVFVVLTFLFRVIVFNE